MTASRAINISDHFIVMLPLDVLGLISSKLNGRTRVRLAATSKQMYSDPRIATRPRKTGFYYGTGGRLQKDYNELAKRIRAAMVTVYVQNDRSLRPKQKKLGDLALWWHKKREAYVKAMTGPALRTCRYADAERVVTRALKEALNRFKALGGKRGGGLPVNNATLSMFAQNGRSDMKMRRERQSPSAQRLAKRAAERRRRRLLRRLGVVTA